MTITEPRCACGAAVDPELLELERTFPKLIEAKQCTACLNAAAHEEAARAREEAEKLEQARRMARLEVIPPDMRRTRVNYRGFNAGLWLKIENWKPSGLRWLGIVGAPGNCKTRCLALLVERLILAGTRVTWTTALEFQDRVDDLRSDEKPIVSAARSYLRRCKTSGVMVLDDLGKNTWTPTLERHLFDVIDHRKTHDLPVLWTANTHPLDLLHSGQITQDRAGALIGRLLEASQIVKV